MNRKISLSIIIGLIIFLVVGIFLLKREPPTKDANANILGKVKSGAVITSQWIKNHQLSLKEAMWYRKLLGGDVQCQLCPAMCVIPEGERGDCGVRANVGGKLRALTFGKPVTVHIDPIEKKPLFHFMPGTPIFSVATIGCNLGCIFCQNWTISQALPEDEKPIDLPPAKLVQKAKEHGCKSIAYTYSEPIIFYEYMYETSKLAHQAGLKNVMVTCGYINPEPLRELCKYIDAANIDLKGFSEEFYLNYTKSSVQPVKEAIKVAKEEGVWVEITNLIIPGGNDDPEQIRALVKWVRDSVGIDTPLHFSRFSPNYKLTDRPPTPIKTLKMAYDIAKEEGMEYVYIGNVFGNEYEDTYCPHCGKLLIDRKGYNIVEFHIEDGRCEFCGEKINGVW